MVRSIYWYINFVGSLILKIPKLIQMKYLKKKISQEEFDELSYKVTTKWADKRIKASGAKITVHGEENLPKENVLFISNHQGNFDIAIFMASIKKDTGFVSKIEIKKMPLVNQWMEFIHCIFMDRNDMKQSLKTILEGISILKSGFSLVVFPEGTRSKSDTMRDFKPGSFKLALKAKVPIVPVTIDGSYKIMEKNNGKIKPAHVDVYIHKPIYTKNLTKEEESELHIKVHEIIKSKLTKN